LNKLNLKIIKKKIIILLLLFVVNLENTITLCEELEQEINEKVDEKNEISYTKIFIYLGITVIVCLGIYILFFDNNSDSSFLASANSELFQNKSSISWSNLQKNQIPYIQLSNENSNIIHWMDLSSEQFLNRSVFPDKNLVAFLDYTPSFDADLDTISYKLVTMGEIRELNLDLSSHVK